MKVQFLGSGGHAGNLRGLDIVESSENKVLAFGGLDCEALEHRVTQRPDGIYYNLVNSSAYSLDYSPTFAALPGYGIQIMVRAILMNNVTIGDFCIINTGAIIEHDTVIGKGCHVAPGAIVLGNCKIGDFCFIGAGAIVIQGSIVPDRTFIKAGSIWNKK